jgi:DNA-binding winged helix-turn-helix (wHTH) protein
MTQIGRFELDLEMRTLSCSGEQIHIGARAFDILALLASMRGRLVTKDELIRYVWPHTIVEENNLQVHLSTLRKALGTDRNLIMTLPGRGYQLAQNPPDMAQSKAAHSGGTQGTLQPLANCSGGKL